MERGPRGLGPRPADVAALAREPRRRRSTRPARRRTSARPLRRAARRRPRAPTSEDGRDLVTAVRRRPPRPRRARRRPGQVARASSSSRAASRRSGRRGRPPRSSRSSSAAASAAVREGRRAAARDVLPAEGRGRRSSWRSTASSRRPRRPRSGRATPLDVGAMLAPAKAGKAAALDRLDRAPRRRRAPLRRRDAPRAREGLDALAAGLPRAPGAPLHRRDLRLLPALGRAADEEAAPDAPQAGARLRRRRRPRDAEPGRPRLQAARELRLLVGRHAPDRARPRAASPTASSTRAATTRRRSSTRTRKRVFLLHDVHRKEPALVETRWAMSYLRGPMTKCGPREAAAAPRTAAAKKADAAPAGSAPPAAAARSGPRAGSTGAAPTSRRAALYVKYAVRYRTAKGMSPEAQGVKLFPLAAPPPPTSSRARRSTRPRRPPRRRAPARAALRRICRPGWARRA